MAKVNGQKIFYKVQGELREPKDEEHKKKWSFIVVKCGEAGSYLIGGKK